MCNRTSFIFVLDDWDRNGNVNGRCRLDDMLWTLGQDVFTFFTLKFCHLLIIIIVRIEWLSLLKPLFHCRGIGSKSCIIWFLLLVVLVVIATKLILRLHLRLLKRSLVHLGTLVLVVASSPWNSGIAMHLETGECLLALVYGIHHELVDLSVDKQMCSASLSIVILSLWLLSLILESLLLLWHWVVVAEWILGERALIFIIIVIVWILNVIGVISRHVIHCCSIFTRVLAIHGRRMLVVKVVSKVSVLLVRLIMTLDVILVFTKLKTKPWWINILRFCFQSKNLRSVAIS